jgi:hypothetical protein
VTEWPYLGHIISANNEDTHDIISRRLGHIVQNNSVLCNFRNVDFSTKIRLVEAYYTSIVLKRTVPVFTVTVVDSEKYLITVLEIYILLEDVESGRYMAFAKYQSLVTAFQPL